MKKTFVIMCSVLSIAFSSYSFATCNIDMDLTRPDSRYTDNLNGTVSDKETGLMWQKCSVGLIWQASDNNCQGTAAGSNWSDAMASAQTANNNADFSYTDWRVPNRNELQSLLEVACHNLSINERIFPATHTDNYWTSTPYSRYALDAWVVNFTDGTVGAQNRGNPANFRLVRTSK